MHGVPPPCPFEQWIPRSCLPRDQIGGRFGAIAEQIVLAVARQPGGKGRRTACDAIDRRVGEPGERHRARIDRLADAAPFEIGRASMWEKGCQAVWNLVGAGSFKKRKE